MDLIETGGSDAIRLLAGPSAPQFANAVHGGDSGNAGPRTRAIPLKKDSGGPRKTSLHQAWAAFAAIGDCGWPKYDLARRSTLRFDTVSEVVDHPPAPKLALGKSVR